MAVIGVAAVGAVASIFGSKKQADAQKAAAEAQKEAARLQTLVARELHEHWKSNYRNCDIAFIREICALPKYTPQYALWDGLNRTEGAREFGRARAELRKCQDTFCIADVAVQCNYIAGIEALAIVDMTNYAFRYEESQRITRDQQRLENLYNWLGLGRNLLNQSGAASRLASAAAANLGAQAGKATNGWLEAAGWLQSESGKRLIAEAAKLFQGPAPSSAPGTQEAVDLAFGSGTGTAVSGGTAAPPGGAPVTDTGPGTTSGQSTYIDPFTGSPPGTDV